MNKSQKNLLIGVAAMVLLMLLYPPFQFKGVNGVVISLGYGFIFNPPGYSAYPGYVDVGLLIAQWMGVMIAGGIGFSLLKSK